MDTITVILDFLSCSVMLGVFYLSIIGFWWYRKHSIKIPKQAKRRYSFFAVMTLLLSIFFCYSSYRRGSFGLSGVAACVINGYFMGHAVHLGKLGIFRLGGIFFLPSVFLLLAIIFSSIFWAVLSGIVIVVLFVIGQFTLFAFDKILSYPLYVQESLWKLKLELLKQAPSDEENVRALLRGEIFDEVKSFLVSYVFRERRECLVDISEDSLLFRDLGLASEHLEWVRIFLEKFFCIDISDKELFSKEIQRVGDVVDLIEDKIFEKMRSERQERYV